MVNVDTTVNWREFACGWGAAFISVVITYPINKLIFRQMLHGVKATDAIIQLRQEGAWYLYRGILPPLFQKTLSFAMMYGVYEEVRRRLMKDGEDTNMSKAAAASFAGLSELLMVPMGRIQTLLQDRQFHKTFKNTFHAIAVVRTYGFTEYYRGLVPIACRNIPCNVIFFNLRDILKDDEFVNKSKAHKLALEFFSGAVLGALLSTFFHPVNVVKVKVQSKLGVGFENPLKVLVETYREGGNSFSRVYMGMWANCLRAALSWGLMNCGYAFLKNLLY